MQIFGKTLTGKTIVLVVDDSVEIGPRRADGTFLVRVGSRWEFVVQATLVGHGISIDLRPA